MTLRTVFKMCASQRLCAENSQHADEGDSYRAITGSTALSPTPDTAPFITLPLFEGVQHSAGNDRASDSTFKPRCHTGAVV